jgi:hypothetical protein
VTCIDRYLGDEQARTSIAARAQALVTARHSWDVRIQEILNRHETFRDVSTSEPAVTAPAIVGQ